MPTVGLVTLHLSPRPSDRGLLLAASQRIERTLYVSLDGDWAAVTLAAVQQRLQQLYQAVARHSRLDVRVLLPPADGGAAAASRLADLGALLAPASDVLTLERLNAERAGGGLAPVHQVELPEWPLARAGTAVLASHAGTAALLDELSAAGGESLVGSSDSVVVGGSFDRLHAGHKLLLSTAALCARRRLVVGVAGEPLLRRKHLRELIQPLHHRTAAAEGFVASVRPGLRCETSALDEPLGPAASDAELALIVVSSETVSGASAVNDARRAASLPPLAVLEAPLVGAAAPDDDEAEGGGEPKLSSTSLRRAELGAFRSARPAAESDPGVRRAGPRPAQEPHPYIVGLTGGIASGKSTAAAALAAMGVATIDADALAHELYAPGGEAVREIAAAFGEAVRAADGGIDRRRLGARVWADAAARSGLNALLWPRMLEAASRRAGDAARDGAPVVVLEAAVLLEAGWDAVCDEVWVVSVGQDEQRRRLMVRSWRRPPPPRQLLTLPVLRHSPNLLPRPLRGAGPRPHRCRRSRRADRGSAERRGPRTSRARASHDRERPRPTVSQPAAGARARRRTRAGHGQKVLPVVRWGGRSCPTGCGTCRSVSQAKS